MEIEYKTSQNLCEYKQATEFMENRHKAVLAGTEPELAWLLQHQDAYTAGISAKPQELLNANNIPVFNVRRGGKFTYHGKGQMVGYFVCNLQKRSTKNMADIRCFVDCLEDIIIKTLAHFGIEGQKRRERIGVWVETQNTEKKIAAIGVRLVKGITMHGFSLNINNDLTKFDGIIPCGIQEYGVCSMHFLGKKVSYASVCKQVMHNIKLAEEQNFYQK